MHLPLIEEVYSNLRKCLLLKADDLYFTMAGPDKDTLRNSFLGVDVEGLADENLTEAEVASIDLRRFEIANNVRQLHEMLIGHRLSLGSDHVPDVEDATHTLEFLEHFLSTLPNVALGGYDHTSARNGEIRKIYDLTYAWLNLVETIIAAFDGKTESTLVVNDLALLSGLDTRTLRNRCGPGKLIRTTAKRASQDRSIASPAFVNLHALDAVDWLKSRKNFKISRIDPNWLAKRLSTAAPMEVTRGLLIAAIVNLGPLSRLAPMFGLAPEKARELFDRGDPLPSEIVQNLSEALGAATN